MTSYEVEPTPQQGLHWTHFKEQFPKKLNLLTHIIIKINKSTKIILKYIRFNKGGSIF